ncbi:MAG: helix-turn-helix transcriptional regulator [Oligosphaeraceae bacterium]
MTDSKLDALMVLADGLSREERLRLARRLDDDQLITLKEAARMLSVCQPYLYKLNREGRLPFVKLAPRCNRVRLSDVRTLGHLGPF